MKFKSVFFAIGLLLLLSCKEKNTNQDTVSQEINVENMEDTIVSSNSITTEDKSLIELLKEGISNSNLYTVLEPFKPTKSNIELKETNQQTLSGFHFAKDEKTNNYFEGIDYYGIYQVYQIDNIEANSKHLFIFRSEGSLRDPYLDCFIYDSQKKEYYLKWQFNRDIDIILFKNKYEFLSVSRDFENWKLKGITFFTFKNKYLHEGKSITINYSNYTAPKYEGSFCKEHKLVTPEIINALNSFEIENFSENDEKRPVTLKNETIFLNKKQYLTSVGYAPNNVSLEIYDNNGNHLEKIEEQINESVVFSKDFKYLERDNKKYLVQYAYFDEKRTINATILKVKVYELIDTQNIKVIEELNFSPQVTFE
ncbi:hypothetical protein FIA58_014705 [Flavobacterium jejuense]|uniref:Uncharacterized protein n=1 Tax=Flavobacterium jejuense TaxID=1544455 RepID=A0ABX0IST8_9FLAO|nr:hypothetical protein [Flavobacterium jejuense]NHN26932.1 hypothetical protein [Flavobacterium jejuense]